jgi:hypothetical protein
MKSLWTLILAAMFAFATVGCEDREVEPEGVAPGGGEVVEPAVPGGEVEVEEPAEVDEQPEATPPAGGAVEAPRAAERPEAGGAAVEEEPVTNPPAELKEEAQQ